MFGRRVPPPDSAPGGALTPVPGTGMRILVIHEYNGPYGGGEQYLRDTCQALRERGHRVALVCHREWNSGFIPCDATYGVTRSGDLSTGLRAWPEYEDVLRQEAPDVVFINGIIRRFISPLVLGRLVRRRPSVVFVHHIGIVCHTGTKLIPGSERPCQWALGIRCVQTGCVRTLGGSALRRLRAVALGTWRLRALRGCRRAIAPSRYVYDELVRNGFPPARVTIVPLFTARGPGQPDLPVDETQKDKILWVGRDAGGKGLDRFFEVLARLDGASWQAVVVGPDTDIESVRARARAVGVAPRVAFLGQLDAAALDREYTAARVVAVTSTVAETFGLVGVEGMAFGKPVVAFDVGGVREWLTDGITGFLVPLNDVETMAERLQRLMRQDDLCREMGLAGQRTVERRFRRHDHVTRLLEVFEEAAGERYAGNGAGR